MSQVDRRQFFVAGLAGMTAACYHFVLNPSGNWLSVQIPGVVRLVRDDSGGGLTVLMIDAQRAEPSLPPHFQRLVTRLANVDEKTSLKSKPLPKKMDPSKPVGSSKPE